MSLILSMILALLAVAVTRRVVRRGRSAHVAWTCPDSNTPLERTWADTWAEAGSERIGASGAFRARAKPARAPVRIGRYEVVRERARGGSAVVYEAYDPLLDRLVALKVLLETTPEEIARFQSEARTVAELTHPHIVSIYGIGESKGLWFQVLELVEGGSLEARVRREGPLDCRAAAVLTAKLARALHSGHLQGVVHRDVKPGNVLVTSEGRPCLIDFGLAKRADGGAWTETLPGTVVGTPSYMSPEQARGEAVDRRTDVYGLGATLYAALTGRAPVRGATWYEVFASILKQDPTAPSWLNARVDPALEAICLKCLEKDPRRRYADALALADDLDRYLTRRTLRPSTLALVA